MKQRVSLHIPEYDELWYRQKILAQPETMNYNKGYNMDFKGYHKDTGCIDFPEMEWSVWYDCFVNHKPERFYAYIVNVSNNEFIGEVNLHKSINNEWHDMGIIIESKHRGRGFAVEALRLLLKVAFEEYCVFTIHNDFEVDRNAATKAHYSVGFKKHKIENGIIHLLLTREDYFNLI